MAAITDEPPRLVTEDLDRLRVALTGAIPRKRAENLLLASWNIRAFGGLAETWRTGTEDSPKRDWHAVHCIAEFVRRFDVVAVQECRADLSAMRALMTVLGERWAFLVTDVTKGSTGNDERLAFVFDTRRVQLSGLAAELVVPTESAPSAISKSAFDRQFARTPYAVSFRRHKGVFVLVSLHVLWGKKPTDRLGELSAIAHWLADWAAAENDINQNLIVLGDFNIDRLGDPLYEAFVSTGLWPPAELNAVPRTLHATPTKPHFYDQIAWFTDTTNLTGRLTFGYNGRAGGFDFRPHVLRGMDNTALSWRLSDHLPLWVELTT
jgi:endonuclease/exonuclease/phosphatase family metal-dependent hydrolase